MITTLESTGPLPRHGAPCPGPGPCNMKARDRGLGMSAASYSGLDHEYGPELASRTSGAGGLPDLSLEPGGARTFGTLVPAAVMEERRRLAREIHDTLAQAFSGILLHLEAAVRAKKSKRRSLPAGLGRAQELARDGLEDARRMLLNLRPMPLESNTLSEALRQLAENFSRDGHIGCSFRASHCENDLPLEVQDELYRMAQEALCNVRKHSRATCASITLDCDLTEVVLSVRDNGRGLPDVGHRAGGRGYGLRMMKERARRIGGSITVRTVSGTGTQIVISVPAPNQTPSERDTR